MERSCRSAVVSEEPWALAPPHSFGNGALASRKRGPRATGRTAEYRRGPAPALGPTCRPRENFDEPGRPRLLPPSARRRASAQRIWKRPARTDHATTVRCQKTAQPSRSPARANVVRFRPLRRIDAARLRGGKRRCSSVVEQLIRNQQVVSSNLTVGSKRPKGA